MPHSLPLEQQAALLSGLAQPSSPVSDCTELLSLKDLVDSSVPDTDKNKTYAGPPIGCSAKVIVHQNHVTKTHTTTVFGSLLAARPLYLVNCETEKCTMCCPQAAATTRMSAAVGQAVAMSAVEDVFRARNEKHARVDSACDIRSFVAHCESIGQC